MTQDSLTLAELEKIVARRRKPLPKVPSLYSKEGSTRELQVKSPFYARLKPNKGCGCPFHHFGNFHHNMKYHGFSLRLPSLFTSNKQTTFALQKEVGYRVSAVNGAFDSAMQKRKVMQEKKQKYLKQLIRLVKLCGKHEGMAYLRNNLEVLLNHFELGELLVGKPEILQRVAACINCDIDTTEHILESLRSGVLAAAVSFLNEAPQLSQLGEKELLTMEVLSYLRKECSEHLSPLFSSLLATPFLPSFDSLDSLQEVFRHFKSNPSPFNSTQDLLKVGGESSPQKHKKRHHQLRNLDGNCIQKGVEGVVQRSLQNIMQDHDYSLQRGQQQFQGRSDGTRERREGGKQGKEESLIEEHLAKSEQNSQRSKSVRKSRKDSFKDNSMRESGLKEGVKKKKGQRRVGTNKFDTSTFGSKLQESLKAEERKSHYHQERLSVLPGEGSVPKSGRMSALEGIKEGKGSRKQRHPVRLNSKGTVKEESSDQMVVSPLQIQKQLFHSLIAETQGGGSAEQVLAGVLRRLKLPKQQMLKGEQLMQQLKTVMGEHAEELYRIITQLMGACYLERAKKEIDDILTTVHLNDPRVSMGLLQTEKTMGNKQNTVGFRSVESQVVHPRSSRQLQQINLNSKQKDSLMQCGVADMRQVAVVNKQKVKPIMALTAVQNISVAHCKHILRLLEDRIQSKITI